MSYKVFQIQNSKGISIGKQQYYSAIGYAKAGARKCRYSLDEGSKIVELEINEVPVSEIKINTKRTKNQYNPNHTIVQITGFGEAEIPNENKETSELIKFN